MLAKWAKTLSKKIIFKEGSNKTHLRKGEYINKIPSKMLHLV